MNILLNKSWSVTFSIPGLSDIRDPDYGHEVIGPLTLLLQGLQSELMFCAFWLCNEVVKTGVLIHFNDEIRTKRLSDISEIQTLAFLKQVVSFHFYNHKMEIY